MAYWKMLACIMACMSLVSSYSCPDIGQTFYHADIESGCKIYHICRGSEMETFNCLPGQAFNEQSGKCEDQSNVPCEKVDFHHLQKRSDVMVHSIPIRELKESALKVAESVRALIIEAVQEVAPSIYNQIQNNYVPVIRKFKADVMPFINDKLRPRIRKILAYVKRIEERVFEKVYKSYELSNSTHINLVSCTDIFNDIAKDIDPILKLGKYLSSRLSVPHRFKREAPQEEMPELLLSFMEPVFSNVVSSIRGMFTGESETLLSKVILPTIFDMAEDPETRFHLKRVFWSLKAAFAPVISDMLSQQQWDSPQGLIVKIPRDQLEVAWKRVETEVKPLKRRILEKHLPSILRRSANNVGLILEAFDRFRNSSGLYRGVLMDSIQRFIAKHYRVLMTSNSSNVHSYALTEILEDLRPIQVTVVQMFMEYLSKHPNALFSGFFNRNSFLYRMVLGDNTPIYATPNF